VNVLTKKPVKAKQLALNKLCLFRTDTDYCTIVYRVLEVSSICTYYADYLIYYQ